jgi:hypothetical protein
VVGSIACGVVAVGVGDRLIRERLGIFFDEQAIRIERAVIFPLLSFVAGAQSKLMGAAPPVEHVGIPLRLTPVDQGRGLAGGRPARSTGLRFAAGHARILCKSSASACRTSGNARRAINQ